MQHRLTIKGQVTIPKQIREHLGLSLGNCAVEFVIHKNGDVTIQRALTDLQAQKKAFRSSHCCDDADRVLALLSGSY